MVLFLFTLLFFVLPSISVAERVPYLLPGADSVGRVFYTSSKNWGMEGKDMYLPVIVIRPPTPENVVVVELALGMDYLQPKDKVPAEDFFPQGMKLSIAGVHFQSIPDNLYINVSQPRTVLTRLVRQPGNRPFAAVKEGFLEEFGYKLRITGYIGPEPPSPESPSPESTSPERPTADTPSETEGRRRTASNPERPMTVMKMTKGRYRSDSDPFK